MAENKKKWSKGKIFWVTLLGIIVLIILVSALSNDSGGNTKNSDTKSNSNKSSQQKDKVYSVGDTINLDNHQLIVNSVNKDIDSGNQFEKPDDPNNDYVEVNVTLLNNGRKDLDFNSFGFTLEDDSGVKRDSTFVSSVTNSLQSATLVPGGKTTGNLVFEAKADSSFLKLHYSPGVFGGNEVVVNL